MPKIKRIIEGQQTITASQDIDAPAGLDINRSIITATIQNAQGAAPDFHIVTRLESISGVPKIRFIRQSGSTNASATIHYRITEFQSGARVQHGQVGFNQFNQSVSNGYRISITTPFKFILNKSIVLISQNGDNADFGSRDTMAAQLTSGNVLQITTGSTASTAFTDIVYWQLVEFTDDTTVERGSVTGNGIVTTTVSTMDLSKCWLIGTARNDGLNNIGMNNHSFTAWISNTTTLSFEKPGGTTGVRIYEWQLVRFNDGTIVRQGIQTIAGGTGSSTPTFTSVNKSNSTIFFNGHNGYSGASTDTTANNGTASSFYISNSNFTNTQITINRNGTSNQLKLGWTVIQFDSGTDEELKLKNSIVNSVTLSTSDTTASVNLPADLDLSKSFLMFTYSVASSTSPGAVFIRGKIWDDSGTKKVTFIRASSGSVAATINYQIFEFRSGINVYSGEMTVSTTSHQVNIGSDVDISKSIPIISMAISGTSGFAQAEATRVSFNSSSQININTFTAFGTKTINWQVLEFKNDCIGFESTGSTATVSATVPTLTDLYMLPQILSLSYTMGGGTGTPQNFFARARFNTNELVVSRLSTGMTMEYNVALLCFKSNASGLQFSFPEPSGSESTKTYTLDNPVKKIENSMLMLCGIYNTTHESSGNASTVFARVALTDNETIVLTRGSAATNGWASGSILVFEKDSLKFSPSGGISVGSPMII